MECEEPKNSERVDTAEEQKLTQKQDNVQQVGYDSTELALTSFLKAKQSKKIPLTGEVKLIMESIRHGEYKPETCPIEDLVPVIKKRIEMGNKLKDDLSIVTETWLKYSCHPRLKDKPDEYVLFF